MHAQSKKIVKVSIKFEKLLKTEIMCKVLCKHKQRQIKNVLLTVRLV